MEKETIVEPEELMTIDVESYDSWDRTERERDIRQGIDLATTLERIEKNFVISDPRIPDNPIVRIFLSNFILVKRAHFSPSHTLICIYFHSHSPFKYIDIAIPT